jgi:hypothetical protein
MMGLEPQLLIAAVKRLAPRDYKLEVLERQVSTGTVDMQDNPIRETRVTIVSLSVRRKCVPAIVHQFKGQLDHPILRGQRFRRYEADRVSEELDDEYYGDSSCEVRSFARHAKSFAYKLSKIPVASRRKEALKSVVKQFDAMIFEHTQENGLVPTDRNESFLMYNVYLGVVSAIRGDCFLTKILATLVFSEDTSCKFRIDPTTYSLTYPSRKRKRAASRVLPENLRAEIAALHKIRGRQNTARLFLNPNKSRGAPAMSYNALTKWVGRYSKALK